MFDKLQEKQIENQRIFFDGQIFDAYSLIIEIFHDRYIILDEKELYHVGASIKDLCKKCNRAFFEVLNPEL